MVNRIVRQFHPEKVILFGSHARGEGGPDSDVAILIITDSHFYYSVFVCQRRVQHRGGVV
ncbi:MAG: nucleotidyltransferase domain-containing protein [Planctomycetota bacterium]